MFFLFWSTAAKGSEYVMQEVRYAIQRQGADEYADPEIVPVIIEGPPPVPPPPELQHLHFNDQIMYFMRPPTSWNVGLRRPASRTYRIRACARRLATPHARGAN